MYEYLKEFIVDNEFEESGKKHTFFPLDENEVNLLSSSIEEQLPNELITFYKEIGFGYFYDKDECFYNLLMRPKAVLEYRMGTGEYVYAEEREFYGEFDLVFYEIDSSTHIVVKIGGKNKGKVYLGKRKIANSVREFVEKLHKKSNYYF